MTDLSRRRAMTGLAAAALLPAWQGCAGTGGPQPVSTTPGASAGGRFETVEAWPSRHAAPRKVVVWLPPGYDAAPGRHAVLYVHDGQEVFDAAGAAWALDRQLADLLRRRAVRPTLVVALWSTPQRWREYVPAPAVRGLPPDLAGELSDDGGAGSREPLSDGYLRFIVEELQPWVQTHWRPRAGRDDTFVMGGGMGALASLYALIAYPQVFGGAACLSPHWVVTARRTLLAAPGDARLAAIGHAHLNFVAQALPRAGEHRLHFDHGTAGLDALSAPFQQRIERILATKGYRPGVDSQARVVAGGSPDAASWRERIAVPLQFLLRD